MARSAASRLPRPPRPQGSFAAPRLSTCKASDEGYDPVGAIAAIFAGHDAKPAAITRSFSAGSRGLTRADTATGCETSEKQGVAATVAKQQTHAAIESRAGCVKRTISKGTQTLGEQCSNKQTSGQQLPSKEAIVSQTALVSRDALDSETSSQAPSTNRLAKLDVGAQAASFAANSSSKSLVISTQTEVVETSIVATQTALSPKVNAVDGGCQTVVPPAQSVDTCEAGIQLDCAEILSVETQTCEQAASPTDAELSEISVQTYADATWFLYDPATVPEHSSVDVQTEPFEDRELSRLTADVPQHSSVDVQTEPFEDRELNRLTVEMETLRHTISQQEHLLHEKRSQLDNEVRQREKAVHSLGVKESLFKEAMVKSSMLEESLRATSEQVKRQEAALQGFEDLGRRLSEEQVINIRQKRAAENVQIESVRQAAEIVELRRNASGAGDADGQPTRSELQQMLEMASNENENLRVQFREITGAYPATQVLEISQPGITGSIRPNIPRPGDIYSFGLSAAQKDPPSAGSNSQPALGAGPRRAASEDPSAQLRRARSEASARFGHAGGAASNSVAAKQTAPTATALPPLAQSGRGGQFGAQKARITGFADIGRG